MEWTHLSTPFIMAPEQSIREEPWSYFPSQLTPIVVPETKAGMHSRDVTVEWDPNSTREEPQLGFAVPETSCVEADPPLWRLKQSRERKKKHHCIKELKPVYYGAEREDQRRAIVTFFCPSEVS